MRVARRETRPTETAARTALLTNPRTNGPGAIGAEARLAALGVYGILDTPPEAAFDDLAHLAALVCGAPTALITFVDGARQFFKARVGFDGDPHAPSDVGFCPDVVRSGRALVVPDTTRDAAYADNQATVQGGVRFYAGIPLATGDGHVLGTLCVLDRVPRPGGLTPDQSTGLERLARQVMTVLALRHSVQHRDKVLAHQNDELRQAWRLDVLAKASAALLVADDPAAVLEAILADGASVLGFDRAYLYDIAPDRKHLRLTHAVNATPQLRRDFQHMPFGTPLCGIVAETRRPLLLSDLRASAEPDYATPRSLGLNAYAGFPVMSQGELSAVISFASTEIAAFDAETLGFFETLARLMSAVYERLDSEADLAEIGAYWRSLFERLSEGFVVGEVIRDDGRAITDWRFVEVNHAWGGLIGQDARSAVGRTIREVFPGIEEGWVGDVARVVETGEPTTFLRRVSSLGRWYEGSAFAVGPERFAITLLEATDRVRAEEERTLLNEEMSHRLKNTLAMVLSIAAQTLRSVPDRAPVEAFEQRIHALSSAHDVLLRRSWAAAPATEVVKAVVAGAGHGDRIDVSGPNIELGPRATLSLSLLLHELATNAAKYGALSVPAGRVSVAWRLEGEGDAGEVVLDWRERDGPPVAAPAGEGRRGFGTRLINLGLAGTGGVDLRYPPTGFQASMRAPLAQLQRS